MMAKTVVGLYNDYEDAERVVRALQDNGFARDDISLIAQDATHGNQPPMQGDAGENKDVKEGAAAGAGTGAVLGGLAGLLVGLGALAIPGIGPIIAAGPIAAALAGAGVGAVTGGIVGALVDAGVPEEQARSYAEAVGHGGTLVAVRTDSDRAEQARDIMNRFHPADMSERARDWRSTTQESGMATGTPVDRDPGQHDTDRQDWSTHDRDVAGSGTPALSESEVAGRSSMASGTEQTMGRSPEGTDQADYTGVGHGSWETRDVSSLVSGEHEHSTESGFQGQSMGPESAGMTMSDRPDLSTHSSTQDMEQAVSDEMAAADREVSDQGATNREMYNNQGQNMVPGGGQFQDEAMDRSRGEDQPQSFDQGVRSTGSSQFQGESVGQQPSRSQDMGQQSSFTQEPGLAAQRDFGSFNSDFRNHYEMIYRTQGYDFAYYEPAYRYGYDLANADRYRGRRWTEIEPEARRAWEQHNPGYGWDYFRDAVRHGWERTASQTGGMSSGTDQGATWSGSSSGSAEYGTGAGQDSDQFTGSDNP